MAKFQIVGCDNCYNSLSSVPAKQEQLIQFYIQSITGVKYLIALCQCCQKELKDLEDHGTLNEGLNFIQDIIKKGNLK